MTDQDRGAYTPPTDAPLSFDPRRPVRGAQPIPLTLIVSGAVLILLVAAIVVFYRSGVREAGEAPAAVGQPVGPLTAAAPPEAQPADPAANLQIYKGEEAATAPAAPNFTPPPEAPQPRIAVTPLPPTASATAGLKPAQSAPAPAPKSAPVAPPVAAPPVAAPKPPPVAVAVARPPPRPVAPPPPVAAPSPPAGGTFGVQIGAFSSRALADKGYADAGRIAGVDIAGRTKRIEEVEKGGSVLYRTTVAGFASRTQAAAFCGQLKAAGKSCFVK